MMQPWFPNAKLGMFMHWGIYSVLGVSESWSFFNGQISEEDYFAQKKQFKAENYDPQAWGELFQRIGAKYAVLTTKHHDGFALWPTEHHAVNSIRDTPASELHDDLIGPYCQAMRDHDIKVGLYFSHLDWKHPDYPSVFHSERPGEMTDNDFEKYQRPLDGIEKPERWEKFIEFHRAQLKELSDRYRPDLFWFDGSWTHSNEQWRFKQLRDQLNAWNPHGVILNSRMGKDPCYGDYETPEQSIPISRPEGIWEFCWTLSDHWGFHENDRHKSVGQLIRMFCDIIGMGGNLLLGIGPQADGQLQPIQVKTLETFGDWLRPRAEAIFDTTAGATHDHFLGSSTLSADQKTLYLFQYDLPQEAIYLKGLVTPVKQMTFLGGPSHGQVLQSECSNAMPSWGLPGIHKIMLPRAACDPYATCIKLELEDTCQFYSGSGHIITQN